MDRLINHQVKYLHYKVLTSVTYSGKTGVCTETCTSNHQQLMTRQDYWYENFLSLFIASCSSVLPQELFDFAQIYIHLPNICFTDVNTGRNIFSPTSIRSSVWQSRRTGEHPIPLRFKVHKCGMWCLNQYCFILFLVFTLSCLEVYCYHVVFNCNEWNIILVSLSCGSWVKHWNPSFQGKDLRDV